MPHKVSPICFENAEASLEVSNAAGPLASTLVTSRMQAGPDGFDDASATWVSRSVARCWLRQPGARPGRHRDQHPGAHGAQDLDVIGWWRGRPAGDARRRDRRCDRHETIRERLKGADARGHGWASATCVKFIAGLGLPTGGGGVSWRWLGDLRQPVRRLALEP